MSADQAPRRLQSADEILRSQRTDLYLGVVAPTGIRRDSFQASLERALRPFGYTIELVRLSELLRDFRGVVIDESSEDARLRTAMDAGSKLRETFGADVLARAAMVELRRRREHQSDSPRAYVFWSLKHPEEVATLRLVYGRAFHLVGLFASEEERLQELQNRPGLLEAQAPAHLLRDQEEEGKRSGQRSRDTFHRADVFLHWKAEPDEKALARFVELLFGRPYLTPLADEHRMFLAYASALRSGELSRQVGAAPISKEGDVLALGANDVPRRGGGLYWPGPDDDRDAARGVDANVGVRRELLGEVAASIAAGLGGADGNAILALLHDSKLREITEYGRAVHAEMEALLACARSGRSTLRSTLYVTTYPCHNCARHIIAAGVERVVFVEPYPKSRALELHGEDLILVPPAGSDANQRVLFEPYLGIGPRRFFDYFSMSLGSGYELQRKDDAGKLASFNPRAAVLRAQEPALPIRDQEGLLGSELVDFRVGSS